MAEAKFSPDKAKFLSREEVSIVLQLIDKDRSDATPDSLTWEKARTYIFDWKLWCFALMMAGNGIVCEYTIWRMEADPVIPASQTPYAYASFLPIILRHGMGFSLRDARE
jgi:hypothetical protein